MGVKLLKRIFNIYIGKGVKRFSHMYRYMLVRKSRNSDISGLFELALFVKTTFHILKDEAWRIVSDNEDLPVKLSELIINDKIPFNKFKRIIKQRKEIASYILLAYLSYIIEEYPVESSEFRYALDNFFKMISMVNISDAHLMIIITIKEIIRKGDWSKVFLILNKINNSITSTLLTDPESRFCDGTTLLKIDLNKMPLEYTEGLTDTIIKLSLLDMDFSGLHDLLKKIPIDEAVKLINDFASLKFLGKIVNVRSAGFSSSQIFHFIYNIYDEKYSLKLFKSVYLYLSSLPDEKIEKFFKILRNMNINAKVNAYYYLSTCILTNLDLALKNENECKRFRRLLLMIYNFMKDDKEIMELLKDYASLFNRYLTIFDSRIVEIISLLSLVEMINYGYGTFSKLLKKFMRNYCNFTKSALSDRGLMLDYLLDILSWNLAILPFISNKKDNIEIVDFFVENMTIIAKNIIKIEDSKAKIDVHNMKKIFKDIYFVYKKLIENEMNHLVNVSRYIIEAILLIDQGHPNIDLAARKDIITLYDICKFFNLAIKGLVYKTYGFDSLIDGLSGIYLLLRVILDNDPNRELSELIKQLLRFYPIPESYISFLEKMIGLNDKLKRYLASFTIVILSLILIPENINMSEEQHALLVLMLLLDLISNRTPDLSKIISMDKKERNQFWNLLYLTISASIIYELIPEDEFNIPEYMKRDMLDKFYSNRENKKTHKFIIKYLDKYYSRILADILMESNLLYYPEYISIPGELGEKTLEECIRMAIENNSAKFIDYPQSQEYQELILNILEKLSSDNIKNIMNKLDKNVFAERSNLVLIELLIMAKAKTDLLNMTSEEFADFILRSVLDLLSVSKSYSKGILKSALMNCDKETIIAIIDRMLKDHEGYTIFLLTLKDIMEDVGRIIRGGKELDDYLERIKILVQALSEVRINSR